MVVAAKQLGQVILCFEGTASQLMLRRYNALGDAVDDAVLLSTSFSIIM